MMDFKLRKIALVDTRISLAQIQIFKIELEHIYLNP